MADIYHALNGVIHIPIGSVYGIFTYTGVIFMVNVDKYTIHGSYGIYDP